VVTAAWRESPRERRAAGIDITGLLTLVGGLFMVVFALMQGPDWGWSDPATMAPLIGGVAVLLVFFRIEWRIGSPLIEVDLFRNGTFTVCNLVVFTAQFSKISVIVFGALYLQDALKMSPLVAGLALLAAVGPVPLLAVWSGQLIDRFGTRPLVLGALALAGGALMWIGLVLDGKSYGLLAPGLIAWGISLSFMFTPPRGAVMNAVPPEKHGQAGGVVMTAQLLGGTIGMAVCGMLYTLTDIFEVVFLANAGLVVAVLALSWRFVAGPSRAPASAPPSR